MKTKVSISILMLVISSLVLTSCSQSQEMKNAFNKGFDEGKEMVEQSSQKGFSKDEALAKIQNYKITAKLENIAQGFTILEYYEKRGNTPEISNNGWFVEEIENGKYQVSYKQTAGNLESNPKWEVTKDNIRAVNGVAITITPEFRPKDKDVEGTDLEKDIYNTFNQLYQEYEKELFEKKDMPSGEELDEVENKALAETAGKYNITSDEVNKIFAKLDSRKYGL